jgi:hypothetical protein
VELLPGQHSFATSSGSTQYFDVLADGTISLENSVNGSVNGNTLTITGVAVTIDPTALGVTTLFVDGTGRDATAAFGLNLLPGQHSFAVNGGTIQYFDVLDDGTISLENPMDGSVNGNLLTLTAAS